MNKESFFTGIVITLILAVSVWGLNGNTLLAAAADEPSHADHDHDHDMEADSHRQEEVEALFEQDEHEDPAHAEGEVQEDHTGHQDHAEHDEHVEHAEHDEHAGEDEHGHDHGGHGGENGICPEHRVPEAEDALCHGDHLAELQPGQGMKVRLASPDVAAKAGIALAEPQQVSLAAGIDIPVRVAFNRNRLARITPLSAGVVRQVRVQPGAAVAQGDLLAEVATPEIASLKAQLFAARARLQQAEATWRREEDLLAKGISSRQEFQQAEAEFQSARSAAEQYRQQLLNFGLSRSDISRLSHSGAGSAVLELRAPFSGTVVEVTTAAGESAEPGAPLFTVAALDALWLELSVPESRIYQAQAGAPIQARFSGLPGMVFSGSIFQAGAVVDERTRTLKVLAEVENPKHRLKVGMFGDARILQGDEQQVLAVPADALQSIDGAPYVFLQEEDDLFEIRRVRTGAEADGMVPILAGLSATEQVVASQGFALKSEVLKARLGASCADH